MSVLRLERLVARTVFWRFFEAGTLSAGVSPAIVLIWVVAFLAVPGYLMAFVTAINLGGSDPDTVLERLLTPTLLLIVFSMVAMSVLALLVWDAVYPDRRDVRILGAIGLKRRTMVVGRVSALAAVAVIVSAGMNALSSLVFGFVLAGYGGAANAVQAVVGHFVAVVCAGLFAFFLVMTMQGSLLLFLGPIAAKRVALVLQIGMVVGLFEAVRVVPDIAGDMNRMWFLAFHATLVGRPSPPPLHYAWWAIGATVSAVCMSIAFLAATHARMSRMALETARTNGVKPGIFDTLLDHAVRFACAAPGQRAVAAFTIRTLTQSRHHLMPFAASCGLALALVSASLVAVFGSRVAAAAPLPDAARLSVPLVVNFILLCGVRGILTMPVDARANWVFRFLADNRRLPELIAGVRTALMLLVVLPATLAAAVSTLPWGVLLSLGHAVFVAVMGRLLIDVLLFRFRAIPFASAGRMDGAHLRTRWPLYLAAFSVYGYSLARVEVWLLSAPAIWCLFVAAAVGLSLLLSALRRSALSPPGRLEYDAADDSQLFSGFGLSEALAAEAPDKGR